MAGSCKRRVDISLIFEALREKNWEIDVLNCNTLPTAYLVYTVQTCL